MREKEYSAEASTGARAQLATILNAGTHTLDRLHQDSDEHAHAHTPNDRPCGSTRQGPDWCAAEAISVCSRKGVAKRRTLYEMKHRRELMR